MDYSEIDNKDLLDKFAKHIFLELHCINMDSNGFEVLKNTKDSLEKEILKRMGEDK